MNDTGAAIDTLHALREMGISIVIDDFGTVFSSLSYLCYLFARPMPFETL